MLGHDRSACRLHRVAPRRPRRRPPGGPVLPGRRLLHRPLAPGRSGRHHPRALRPRAHRPHALPRAHRQRRHPAHAPGRGHRPADPGLWRGHRAERRAHLAASGRPRAGLGAGAAGTRRARVGRLGRLQDRRRRHLRAVRAGALRHLHHRIHVRPAHLPLADPGRTDRRHRRLVAAQCRRGPRLGAAVLCLRQGPAHPARRRRLHRADRGAWRGRAAQRRLPCRRRGAAADLPCQRPRRRRADAQARPGAGATLGAGHAVDEALRQLRRCLRERLDAAARHAPAARRRPGLRDVRPRRLARPAEGHRRHRRRTHLRDPRQRGDPGALAQRERPGSAGLQDRIRRRRRG